MKRKSWAYALVPFLVAGCATVSAPGIEQLPVGAVVVNQSGKTISQVTYQPCEGGGDNWANLGIVSLRPGQSTSFALPAACINLRAFYADGKVAGSQVGIRRDFPFKWTIS